MGKRQNAFLPQVSLCLHKDFAVSSSNNHVKTIHDFDFNLICEYFSGLQRQGPGSAKITTQAAGFIDNLSSMTSIADLG